MKKRAIVLLVAFLILRAASLGQYKIKTINFLSSLGLKNNASGPVFVLADSRSNKVFAANAMSSSLTVIDAKTRKVFNIPLKARALQHLKENCFAYNPNVDKIYLIANRYFFVVDPVTKDVVSFPTEKQFESVAVDEKTGNAVIVGRESSKIGFFNFSSKKLTYVDWLKKEYKLINENQTPPPPIRFAVAINDGKSAIAVVDGYTSRMWTFDGKKGKLLKSRKLPLKENDGRWHYAGLNRSYKRIFIGTETKTRKMARVASIDVFGTDDIVMDIPKGFSEPVGFAYNPNLNEVYVSYDNNFFVHCVNFNKRKIYSIPVPAYGNDAMALDEISNALYVGSWAHGEIEVLDVKRKKFVKKIEGLKLIPHMFSMAFNRASRKLYYPVGASAVNGTFGAAITELDPKTEKKFKIRTGWVVKDFIEIPSRKSFLVFNNEDMFSETNYGGSYKTYLLPFDYPICAARTKTGDIYLSYGPHQSYWPNPYIWAAKDGLLKISKKNLSFYDRRIPRQALQIVVDKNNVAYLTQNNWGKEEQFILPIEDEIRYPQMSHRIKLGDTLIRETTQRVMKYDADKDALYLARLGEKDDEPSIFQAIDLKTKKVVARKEIGRNPVDMLVAKDKIYVANFQSNSVSVIDKNDYSVVELKSGKGPIKLVEINGKIYAANALSRDIVEVKTPEINRGEYGFKVPFDGDIDNAFVWDGKIILTGFASDKIFVYSFDPQTKRFAPIFERVYPYGEVSLNTKNAAFYVSGCFADATTRLTKFAAAADGSLWISDYLGGKIYILEK